ncbi:MAG: hypothetical protein JSW46_16625, partial [Gemmatimonadota bacterium]
MNMPPAPPRILLTGRPGCGKTTVIKRAVELIGPDRCAGFYTEDVREKGRRIGFDVVTLDGRRGPLARAGARGPRVSRYGVELASFEGLGVGGGGGGGGVGAARGWLWGLCCGWGGGGGLGWRLGTPPPCGVAWPP